MSRLGHLREFVGQRRGLSDNGCETRFSETTHSTGPCSAQTVDVASGETVSVPSASAAEG
jgi:hypothetical protein